jgi:O-antigen/teichoic acid export membrane protein
MNLLLRIQKRSQIMRELIWISAGQAAAAMAGIVGVRLLTHAMNPRSYGEMALGMTAATLVNQLIFGPVANVPARFYAPAVEAEGLRALIEALRRIVRRCLGLLAVLTLLLCLTFWTDLVGSLPMLLAALAFSAVAGCATICDALQNAARHRAVVAWHQGLSQWLRFLFAIVLLRWVAPSSWVAMIGFAIGTALVLPSQLWFLRRRIGTLMACEAAPPAEAVTRSSKEILRYVWPFCSWGIFTWLQLSSDRWALQAFRSTLEVGLYQSVYQLGYYPVFMLSSVTMQLVTPIIFARAGDGQDPFRLQAALRLNAWIYYGIVSATAVAVAGAVRWHDQVFHLLTAPAYWSAAALLPAMVLSSGLFAAAQAATVSVLCINGSVPLVTPKIAVAISGVALNVVGAYYRGGVGVVWAGALVSALYFVWILLLVLRIPARLDAAYSISQKLAATKVTEL